MGRFLQFAFVALLALGASGLFDLAVPESCQLAESSTQGDADCPATCVRCSCCPLAIELLAIGLASSPIRVSPETVVVHKFALPGSPSEVLHVPKLALL